MCTALHWQGRFGRNLDLEYELPGTVTLTPRHFALPGLPRHHALLGMALIRDGFPLYFDAMNEAGLAIAGLRFADSACYGSAISAQKNIPSWLLIPWLLGKCSGISEVKSLLPRLQITDEPFSAALPPSPLHWMIADLHSALVLEACRDGLHWYDAPLGVLTNEPPFPVQLAHWEHFASLPPSKPGAFSPTPPLPADASSAARFVRTAFTRRYADPGESPTQTTAQFFRILEQAAAVKGCVRLADDRRFYTRYTGCCDLSQGSYLWKTYWDPQMHSACFSQGEPDSDTLQRFP